MRRESSIEKTLKDRLEGMGCVVRKWVAPGSTGVPDRLVFVPGGHVIAVEMKTEIGKLSGVQRAQIKKLQKVGADVRVIYGIEEVNAFTDDVYGMIQDAADLREALKTAPIYLVGGGYAV